MAGAKNATIEQLGEALQLLHLRGIGAWLSLQQWRKIVPFLEPRTAVSDAAAVWQTTADRAFADEFEDLGRPYTVPKRVASGLSPFTKEHPKAADALNPDWERMVAFYSFPKTHWRHLRTTNIIGRCYIAL